MSGLDALIRQTTSLQICDGDNSVIAGLDVMRKPNGLLWATNLWVKPEYRGKWYPVALIRRMCKEYGTEDIYCEAVPYTDRHLDTERLIKFYNFFGFRETGVPGILKRDGERNIQN